MKAIRFKEAEASLAALVDAAEKGESTMITRDGKPAAIITPASPAAGMREFSAEDNQAFINHLLSYPGGIELERDQSQLRDFEFRTAT